MKGYTERVPFTVHKSGRLLELSMLGMDIHEDPSLVSAHDLVREIKGLPIELFSPMLFKKISNLVEINNHMLDWQKILREDEVDELQSMLDEYEEKYKDKYTGVFVDYMNEIRTTISLYSNSETYLENQKVKRSNILQEDDYEEDDVAFKFLADSLLGEDSSLEDALNDNSKDLELPDKDVVYGKVSLGVDE